MSRPSVAGWRDTALFLTGLALIVNEAVIRTGPTRPDLLILYAGMIGLPAVLRADSARSRRDDEAERDGPT